VRREERFVFGEQRPISGRDGVAAVLAGDEIRDRTTGPGRLPAARDPAYTAS
jgi:hypothetical protein